GSWRSREDEMPVSASRYHLIDKPHDFVRVLIAALSSMTLVMFPAPAPAYPLPQLGAPRPYCSRDVAQMNLENPGVEFICQHDYISVVGIFEFHQMINVWC